MLNATDAALRQSRQRGLLAVSTMRMDYTRATGMSPQSGNAGRAQATRQGGRLGMDQWTGP